MEEEEEEEKEEEEENEEEEEEEEENVFMLYCTFATLSCTMFKISGS